MNSVLTLLGLITSGSDSDTDLKNSYNRYFRTTSHEADIDLQAILTNMVADGVIRSTAEDAGCEQDRQQYEPTPKGRGMLEEWMMTPEEPSDNWRSELYAKVVISLLIDQGADAAVLDIHQRSGIDHMRRMTKLKLSALMTDILFYDYTMHHIEADLRWMDLTSARPKEPKKDMR